MFTDYAEKLQYAVCVYQTDLGWDVGQDGERVWLRLGHDMAAISVLDPHICLMGEDPILADPAGPGDRLRWTFLTRATAPLPAELADQLDDKVQYAGPGTVLTLPPTELPPNRMLWIVAPCPFGELPDRDTVLRAALDARGRT